MTLPLIGSLIQWGLILAGCWLVWQLMRQNGRILLRLEALEQQLAQPAPQGPAPPLPTGLPLGAAAPEFRLPTLAGGERALSEWRGRRVVLVFFDPRCGFCHQLAPTLAAMAAPPVQGRPALLLVSGRGAEENRELVEKHGLRCTLLLDDEGAVARRYQARGTPMGYLLDEHGRIASELAVGGEAIMALATLPAGEGEGIPARAGVAGQNGNGTAHAGGPQRPRGNRSLADSRINRNGLPAGTPAPSFRLPTPDGGEMALEEYRGRKVLLVFSDPHCGPCDQLAPRLEKAWRAGSEAQILMVSRGDADVNRVKVAQLGLTFPVGLQRQWEISKQYAMFATPIAYLIDAEGSIAADVAVGVEPILELLGAAEKDSPRREFASTRSGDG